jgi:hydrogenase maturation protease
VGGEVGGAYRRERSTISSRQTPEAPKAANAPALVIGLGNPLRGDDGIGPAVIEALRPARGAAVTLLESSGHDLTERMASEAFDRIIVIDAANLGRPPGAWQRLTADRLASTGGAGLTHGMGLVGAIHLLTALGLEPEAPIVIYAVQPAAVGWGPGLSREARRAVTAVAAAVRQELGLPQARRRPFATDGAGRCSRQGRKSVACPAWQSRVTEERKETHG